MEKKIKRRGKLLLKNILKSIGWSLAAGIISILTMDLIRIMALVAISLIQGNYYEGIITCPTMSAEMAGVSIVIMIFVFDHSLERLVKKQKTKTA